MRRSLWILGFLLVLSGCEGEAENYDLDGDGSLDSDDCAPADPAIHPGADEPPDGIDNDCDGQVDEDTLLADDDGDGFCEGLDLDEDGALDCSDGATAGDCDDESATSYPGAKDVCGDGVDANCDLVDGLDLDGDGYVPNTDDNETDPESVCHPDNRDCDDGNSEAYPGNPEVCDGGLDNDCDKSTIEGFDRDGDEHSTCTGDCDDLEPRVHPGADEVCDHRDNDCDGAVDEDFADDDGDGWASCDGALDCDDSDGSVHPGQLEDSDSADIDCDGGGVTTGLEHFALTLVGEATVDELELSHQTGSATASAGDVDGDGQADLLVGAPGADVPDHPDAGKTYLFFGSTLASSGSQDLAFADAVFLGGSEGAESGASVASAGDIDGDGLADLLIGEPSWSTDGDPHVGRVHLFLGSSVYGRLLVDPSDREFDLEDSDACFHGGETRGDRFGEVLPGPGDVDGDGVPDLLVGAPSADGDDPVNGADIGKVYLWLGSSIREELPDAMGCSFEARDADLTIPGEVVEGFAGTGLTWLEDMDADGQDEILIGVPDLGDGGTTYLLLGAGLAEDLEQGDDTIALDEQADYLFFGTDVDSRTGGALSGVGDVDGDGRGDLVLGSDLVNSSAYMLLGSRVASVPVPPQAARDVPDLGKADYELSFSSLGGRAVPVGDLDADGRDDLLVGGAGAAEVGVLLGSELEERGDYGRGAMGVLLSTDEPAGASLTSAGDVDGDGRADFLVPEPSWDDGRGRVHLVFGAAVVP